MSIHMLPLQHVCMHALHILDAKLLKAILLKMFKSENVQDAYIMSDPNT